MKRIDDLTGATIQRVEVSRSGIMHIWLDKRRNADGSWAGNVEWRPLRVAIPKEAEEKGKLAAALREIAEKYRLHDCAAVRVAARALADGEDK